MSSDNESETIPYNDYQDNANTIEYNLEPETILIEIENTDKDDEHSLENNLDEYTRKCGEIYICEGTKKFHLYCYYCRIQYNNFGLLSEHITEIHFPFNFKRQNGRRIMGLDLYLCGQIFMSDICRFVHICVICKGPFEEYKKLLKHYLDHKNSPGNDVSYLKLNNGEVLPYKMMPDNLIPTKKRKYLINTILKCKFCKREFETDDDRKSHACERPWPCKICGKSFKTNWNLIEHTRVHTGEKPFHCDKCDKSFTKSGNLNVHRLTHTENVPIKCDFCWSIFSQKSTLKSHIRRLHPDADHEFQVTRRFNKKQDNFNDGSF